jgi:methylmalonyl-CoA mutase N-terminal domain/subunit
MRLHDARNERPLVELDAGPSVKPFYTEQDLAQRRDHSRPGEFPYTRGVSGERQRPLVKLYTGLGTPEQSNERLLRLVELGVEVIQLATDLPSQVGYDSDHVMATAEVGRAGVAIASLCDMQVLFKGIPLSRLARVSMLGNATGPISLALFVALGERQGLRRDEYVVDLQNDPLKEYVARGTQFLPVRPALRLAADVVEWCAREAPHWYPLDACGNHLNAAGAGSTLATAFAFANTVAYIEELLARGLAIDDFAPMMQMFLDEREDFFVAVANIRASRRIWAAMMRDRFGAADARSHALQITAYGHGRETRVEPLNNIVRIALGCLAYRLAGVQTMYSSSYDEARTTPTDESVVISARTQQILNEEQGLDATVDPLGGSYYVEALTDEIEQRILRELEKIDAMGGAVTCIENGYFRSVIADGALRRQKWFEEGRRAVVGVNRFKFERTEPNGAESTASADADAESIQKARLKRVRRERDTDAVIAALAAVGKAAREGRNVVPATIDAVRAYATVGEISDVFRAEFGEWLPDQQF